MGRRLNEYPELASHDIVTRALRTVKAPRSGDVEFGGMTWAEPLEHLARSLDREARLTTAARRRVRAELVALLAGRAGPPPPKFDAGRALVVVTGLDGDAIRILESALRGERATTASASNITSLTTAARFASNFASLSFEERWHVPTYAEWLHQAPLDDVVADVIAAAGVAHTEAADPVGPGGPGDPAPAVVGAVEFLEHFDAVRSLAPRARLVHVTADPAAATRLAVERSVTARRRDDPDADPARVGRYWSWRLEMLAAAFERSAATPAVVLDATEIRSDPAAAAASAWAALTSA